METLLGSTAVGVGYGKASKGRSVVVDVHRLDATGGELRSDANMLGSFTLSAGTAQALAGVNTSLLTGNTIVAVASAPGVVLRVSGTANLTS